MKKKLLSSMLCLVLGASVLAGCANQVQVEPVEKVSAVAAPKAAAEAVAETVAEAAPAAQAPAAQAPAAQAPAAQAPAAQAPAAQAPAAQAAQEAVPLTAEAAPAQEAAPAAEATPAATPVAEVTPAATPAAEVTPAVEDEKPALPEGQMYSYLTGEPIDKAIGEQRPFAVMINNLDPAVPQSGIIYADILYEAFVESDITRMMAVFQEPRDLEKIGPVRSCRHYYLFMSDDNEAVYTHFGWSFVAEDLINNEGRTTINGMFYDGSMGFFRTSDRVAPHNAYVTGQGLEDIADSLGVDRSYPENYTPNLHFNVTDTELAAGVNATAIQLPYPVNNPWFEYNAEDGLYYRFEYSAPHVDMETGEQLKFKNVLVQFVDQEIIPETPLLELNMFSEGRGMYFTDGKAIPITWKKDSEQDRTHYFAGDGSPLYLNPGKTMIQIIPESYGVTYTTDQGEIDTSSQLGVEDTAWNGEDTAEEETAE